MTAQKTRGEIDLLTKDDLTELPTTADQRTSRCFMPTHRAGRLVRRVLLVVGGHAPLRRDGSTARHKALAIWPIAGRGPVTVRRTHNCRPNKTMRRSWDGR